MSVDISQAKSIFLAALERPDQERVSFLDAQCGTDGDLRRRVEAMLQADANSAELLPRPPAEMLASEPDAISTFDSSAETPRKEPATAAADDLAFLAPPTKPGALGRLGHYEVLEAIGKGGFGIVLRAFDEKLHRIVAIKVLAPAYANNGSARKRFIREARAAAAVKNEHVVGIHDVQEQAQPPYLVMEYIEGIALQDKIDKHGALGMKEILRIGMQMAEGLAAAHKQGLVHRDIKPANILLENGVERVKITDFGLARAVDDASVTQSGTVAGTPMFMSPEQAEGLAVDHRSDLFSLGTVLYAMCTGHPPFRASGTHAVLKRVIEETPRPIWEINPDIPDWLEAIVAKLHAKKPTDRFHTAMEVAELLGQRLAEVQAGRAGSVSDRTEAARSPVAPIAGSTKRRRKGRLVAATGLFLLSMALWFFGERLYLLIQHQGRLAADWTDPNVTLLLVSKEQDPPRSNVLRAGESVRLPSGPYSVEAISKSGREIKGLTFAQPWLDGGMATTVTASADLRLGRGDRVVVRVALGTIAPEASEESHLLQGRWTVVSQELAGRPVEARLRIPWLEFAGDRLRTKRTSGAITEQHFSLDSNQTPRHIDLWGVSGKDPEGIGIYQLKGETPTLCIGEPKAGWRPQSFETTDGRGLLVVTHCVKVKNQTELEPPLPVAPFDAGKAREYQAAWANHLGVDVETTNSIGVKLRLIPPGVFEMAPNYRPYISRPYRIGIHKVTVGQFREFVKDTGYKTFAEASGKGAIAQDNSQDPKNVWDNPKFAPSDQHPVGCLDWNDAVRFCEWLSKKESKPYRLPTDAEWEWACRAGSMKAYFWGDDPKQFNQYDWPHMTVHAVGGKAPNPWGLFDLYGIIAEFCLDSMGDFPQGTVTNPRGLAGGPGDMHVVRGVQSNARFRAGPTHSYFHFGLRVVCEDVGPVSPPPAIAPFDEKKARECQEAWAKHLGVPLELTNAIGMKLRLIPPGKFQMGSDQDEIEPLLARAQDFQKVNLRSETPRRSVDVPAPFYLGQFVVTVGQFRKFIAETGHKTTAETNGKGGSRLLANGKPERRPEWIWRHADFAISDDHPVVQVSLADVNAFCAWLSKKDGRAYAVPDEEGWEFACRAGKISPVYGGDLHGLSNFAWFAYNFEGTTHAVGGKLPNAFGLFDMLGNVEQLCRAHDRGVVCRGGVAHDILSVRCSARRPIAEGDVYFRRGFRVAIVGELKAK